MRIARQEAVLNMHLGDAAYLMFGDLKVYFKYNSFICSMKGKKFNHPFELADYLVKIGKGKSFGPHKINVNILSGDVVLSHEHCSPQHNCVCLKNLVMRVKTA